MKFNQDPQLDIGCLYFLVGAIITYFGGLYGVFDVRIGLIVPGILIKFYGAFLIFIYIFSSNNDKTKPMSKTKRWRI